MLIFRPTSAAVQNNKISPSDSDWSGHGRDGAAEDPERREGDAEHLELLRAADEHAEDIRGAGVGEAEAGRRDVTASPRPSASLSPGTAKI